MSYSEANRKGLFLLANHASGGDKLGYVVRGISKWVKGRYTSSRIYKKLMSG